MTADRRNRWFHAAAAVLITATLWNRTAVAASTDDDVRRVLTLLSAAGEDYREGIQDGAVTRPVEWEEAKAFLQDAQSRWQKVASQLANADLTQTFDDAATAMANKATPGEVAAKLSIICQRIGSVSGITEDIYPPEVPSAPRGKALFDQYCASCHGQRGDGKGPSAALLNPRPANFADAQFMRGETPYDFFHVISLGKRNTAMPAWDESLSVQERWDLVSYIWTFAVGDAGIAEGQGLYLTQCASCHGATGDGRGEFRNVLIKNAPDVTHPQILARRTDAELFALTSEGVSASPMPPFVRTLSEDERWKAVAFMRLLSLGGVQKQGNAAEPDAGMQSRVTPQTPVHDDEVEAALAESARLLDAGVLAYGRNDPEASAIVADGYMQFEPLEKRVSVAAPGLTQQTEEHFLRLRQLLRAPGNGAAVAGLARVIHQDLTSVRAALEPHASPYALFAESATIILREGLEIVLVIGALIAYVVKTRNAVMQRSIYAGVGLGILASFATALIMGELLHLHPAASDMLEGVTMLVAAVVLFWVSYWLISKSEAAKWHRYIQGRVQTALRSGGSVALASAAFLAVYREGFETVLFYQALYASAPAASMTITLGFVAGLSMLLVVYWIFRRFEIQIPVRQFFFVTGLLLYAMAAIFAGQGVHELQEAGIIGLLPVDWVPSIPFLGVYPSVQSLGVQAVFVALLVYATVVTLRRSPKLAAREAGTPALPELRAIATAMEELRQELNAIRLSGAPAPLPSLGKRLEGLLTRVEELAGSVDVKLPDSGGTHRGGR